MVIYSWIVLENILNLGVVSLFKGVNCQRKANIPMPPGCQGSKDLKVLQDFSHKLASDKWILNWTKLQPI
jgi:hypothetical protein